MIDTADGHNVIVSLSGGKDSVASALLLLDLGVPIHSAAFFDTGCEFPEVLAEVARFEATTGVRIVRLHPWADFRYWLAERPVRRNGRRAGEIYRMGHGWPSIGRRWCTRMKVDAINKYAKSIPDALLVAGIAADETRRCKEYGFSPVWWPLIDFGLTEADALAYCYRRGYTWDGVYDWMPSRRVSCWCCPLQGKKDLAAIRRHRPDYWQRILDLDAAIPPASNRGFYKRQTAADLEREFCAAGSLLPSAGCRRPEAD